MSDADHARVKEVFQRACELGGVERMAFLNEACSGDTALRRAVDELLAYDTDPQTIVQRLEQGGIVDLVPPAPSRIGPYQITEFIGEWGGVEVFQAVQTEPVRRNVAIKIVKRGIDDPRTVARIETELEALSLMDHPNVARVLDAGETDDRRRYCVMELVAGRPIVDYADRHRLDVDARLRLFVQACDGVQHAHQKGLIHRDLRPNSILVTVKDGDATAKVVNFGVTKDLHLRIEASEDVSAVDPEASAAEYMSPELASPRSWDIDTRSDVFSLGVLLHELLVGVLPHYSPHPPSVHVAELGADAAAVAERRRTDPARLVRRLRGELDAIVMKALEREPLRRYDTASEFAGDIRRHLDDAPVAAVDGSSWYRLRKLVRRHRLAVALGAVGVLVLLAAAAGITRLAILSHAETRAMDRAEDALLHLHEVLLESFGAEDPRTRDAAARLVELYEDAGRADDAEAWRERGGP